MGKSNSFANGPGAGVSAYNGPDVGTVVAMQHSETCCCIWCLQGIR